MINNKLRRRLKRAADLLKALACDGPPIETMCQMASAYSGTFADTGAVEPQRYLPFAQGLLGRRLERFGAQRAVEPAVKIFASSNTGMRS